MTIRNHARICLIISAVLLVAALLLSVFGLGINMGIDFRAGQSIRYSLRAEADQSTLERLVNEAGIVNPSVTIQGENRDEAIIRSGSENGLAEERAALDERIREVYPLALSDEIKSVSASFSSTLIRNAVESVLIAAILMLVYIAIRFDLNSGLAAVFGLLHDVAMMLAFMVFLRSVVQMNSTFIAAMLTIVGYSINNTIVIFDRIRENVKKYVQYSRVEVVNISIRECLGRTINTTLTTLVTIVLLYIMGVDSIREFALPIIVGILSGVYSANMINGYVWAWLEDRRAARKARKPAVREEA
ncbi:MAG: protein translocase subunit SecF [Clostridia bacterium]|nr:protein translocase subunit SecF [Clostridia bacterium]